MGSEIRTLCMDIVNLKDWFGYHALSLLLLRSFAIWQKLRFFGICIINSIPKEGGEAPPIFKMWVAKGMHWVNLYIYNLVSTKLIDKRQNGNKQSTFIITFICLQPLSVEVLDLPPCIKYCINNIILCLVSIYLKNFITAELIAFNVF